MIKRFLSQIFNSKNITKIIIIFTIGLSTRIIINNYYNINVFNDYSNKVSIIYYLLFSGFVVITNNIIDIYDISIIPKFNVNINQLKFEYFKLSYTKDLFSNLFNNFNNKLKIPMGNELPEDNIGQTKEFKNIINLEAKNNNLKNNLNSYDNKSIRRIPKYNSLHDDYNSNYTKSNTSHIHNYEGKSKEPTSSKTLYPYNTAEINSNNTLTKLDNEDIIFSPKDVGWNVNNSRNLVNDSIYDGTVVSNETFNLESDNYNTPSTMTPLFDNNEEIYNTQSSQNFNNLNDSYCTNNTNHGTVSTTPDLDPLNSRPVYSVNWDERRGPILQYMQEMSPVLESTTQEFKLQTKSKSGQFKIGFKLLDNSINKIEKVYIKYHDIAKRKLYWNLWVKETGDYSSYSEFKAEFDPNTNIWKEIKAATKNDVSKEVNNLLRSNPFNKPSIKGRNIHQIGLTSTQEDLNRLQANKYNAHNIKHYNIKHKHINKK